MTERLSAVQLNEIRKEASSLVRWIWYSSPRVYVKMLLAELDALRSDLTRARADRDALAAALEWAGEHARARLAPSGLDDCIEMVQCDRLLASVREHSAAEGT